MVRGTFGVGSSGYRTKTLMMLRLAKEVRNGKIIRTPVFAHRGIATRAKPSAIRRQFSR